MSTDTDQSVKAKADKQLSEHTSRYGHLMQVHSIGLLTKLMILVVLISHLLQTQLMGGVKKSFEFQKVIAEVCFCLWYFTAVINY